VWRPSRILVGTDYSATAEQALRAAVGTAQRTGAAVDLVHSVDDGAQAVTGYAVVDDLLTGAAYWKRARAHAREALEKLAREVGPTWFAATPRVSCWRCGTAGDPTWSCSAATVCAACAASSWAAWRSACCAGPDPPCCS
jgi:nucleotide-binding universal stress UspA family protein